MTHDGLGQYLSQIIQKAEGNTADLVPLLRDTKTDVLVNYLPVGSEMATKWYVEQALEAGCGFINCIPVFIASGWVQNEAGEWKPDQLLAQPLQGAPACRSSATTSRARSARRSCTARW